ncbi:hypothetical protein NKH49_07405 [Mesorhizobium sp. M1088]|uniref:hypothetical protein n=1 Tax=Mesorhizobium sp. M1088 TaxID=2957056 RepID=UPI0033376E9D
MPPETQPEVALFSTRGLFQPHLQASIRYAFRAPVRFAPDLIARRDISVGLGLQHHPCRTVGAFAADRVLAMAAALEGNGGLTAKSQAKRDPSPGGKRKLFEGNSSRLKRGT